MHMTGGQRIASAWPDGTLWGAAFAALLGCAAFATQARGGVAEPLRALPMLAVVIASAALGSPRQALGLGVMGWAFCDGFVVDRYGELVWHAAADAWRLTAFIALAATATLVASRRRSWQMSRSSC